MSVVPTGRRLYLTIAVRTPTVGDGRRTAGTTDIFQVLRLFVWKKGKKKERNNSIL
jgi:hypothetical protein